jgi:flagellar motor switch protein FliG
MICILTISGDETGAKSVRVAHFQDGRTAANYQRSVDKTKLESGWTRTEWAEDWKEYSLEIKEPWTFEDVLKLDDRFVQRVMREIDSQDLAKALKGTEAKLQDVFFRNMSKRAAIMLKEDIAFMGPVAPNDVEASRGVILSAVERLIDSGETPDPRTEEIVF